MSNGWTGGQYSLFRIAFGVYLCVHFGQLAPWAAEYVGWKEPRAQHHARASHQDQFGQTYALLAQVDYMPTTKFVAYHGRSTKFKIAALHPTPARNQRVGRRTDCRGNLDTGLATAARSIAPCCAAMRSWPAS
jgi:hypothetical protein